MAVTAKVLMSSRSLNALNSDYIANGVTTIIDKITARNFGASSSGVSVYICEKNEARSDNNLVLTRTINPGETYTFPEIVGQMVSKGGFMTVQPYNNNVISLRVCGREID